MKKSECFHLFIHSWNLFYYYDHLALGDENVPIQGPVFVLCVCELERYWERERERAVHQSLRLCVCSNSTKIIVGFGWRKNSIRIVNEKQ